MVINKERKQGLKQNMKACVVRPYKPHHAIVGRSRIGILPTTSNFLSLFTAKVIPAYIHCCN